MLWRSIGHSGSVCSSSFQGGCFGLQFFFILNLQEMQINSWIWEPTSSVLFSIVSVYELCREKSLLFRDLKMFGTFRTPLKCSIFVWHLLNGILPFPEVLVTLVFNLPSKCPWCEELDTR